MKWGTYRGMIMQTYRVMESDLKSHQESGCLQLSLLVTSTVLSAAALDTREAGLPITLTDNAHTESKMAEV